MQFGGGQSKQYQDWQLVGCLPYYEWWAREVERKKRLDGKLQQVDRDHWRQMRRAASRCPTEQLKRYRFRHRQAAFLASLEMRWQQATGT